MAELNGILKFTGSIGDFVAYEMNGKIVIRRKPIKNKKKYKTDPAYARCRESNSEFGAASMLSAHVRRHLFSFIKQSKDGSLNNRLTGLSRTNIKNGLGKPGQRSFLWNNMSDEIKGLNFNAAPLVDSFLSRYPWSTGSKTHSSFPLMTSDLITLR